MVFPFPELQKKVLDVVRGDDARFRGGQYAEGVYQVFLPQSQPGFLHQHIVNIQGSDGKGSRSGAEGSIRAAMPMTAATRAAAAAPQMRKECRLK